MSRLLQLSLLPRLSLHGGAHTLHNWKADSSARKFGRYMQALERFKQFVRTLHIESGSVIADEICWLAILLNDSHFNMRLYGLPLNFQALPSKLVNTMLNRFRSPQAIRSGAISTFTLRSGVAFCNCRWLLLMELRDWKQNSEENRFFVG